MKVLIAAHVMVRVEVLARNVLREILIRVNGVESVVGSLRGHGVHIYPANAQGRSVDVDVECGYRRVHHENVARGVDREGVVGILGARVGEVVCHRFETELALLRTPCLPA